MLKLTHTNCTTYSSHYWLLSACYKCTKCLSCGNCSLWSADKKCETQACFHLMQQCANVFKSTGCSLARQSITTCLQVHDIYIYGQCSALSSCCLSQGRFPHKSNSSWGNMHLFKLLQRTECRQIKARAPAPHLPFAFNCTFNKTQREQLWTLMDKGSKFRPQHAIFIDINSTFHGDTFT